MINVPLQTKVVESNHSEPNSDLEKIADDLLSAHACMGRENGIYTQIQLDRKIRRDYARTPEIDEYEISSELVEQLTQRKIDDLIEASRLTFVQELIFRLYLGGLSCRNIQATLKTQRRTIADQLRIAKRKVRMSYSEGRYAGWYEVYLSEVNRPAYRRRK